MQEICTTFLLPVKPKQLTCSYSEKIASENFFQPFKKNESKNLKTVWL